MVLRLRHAPRLDVALALLLVLWAVADSALRGFDRPLLVPLWIAAMAGAMPLRRRMPLAAFALLLAGLGVRILSGPHGDDPPFLPLALLVVVYSSTAYGSTRWRQVAGASMALAVAVSAFTEDPGSSWHRPGDLMYFLMLFGTPLVAGAAIHRFRARTREAVDRAVEAERARSEAAAVERQRVARELHDVVGHAISVIVLQARGGRRMLGSEPVQAREALDAIERTAGEALTDVRRLVGMLHAPDAGGPLAPQPSLAHLDRLLDNVRAAGLPVDLEIEGAAVALPPGVDLSLYRIVQEALTNALRHAGPASAHVILRYAEATVAVEIRDDGTGGRRTAGGGHGLAGIRERVSLLGGTVEAGGDPGGGFVLRAALPLGSGR
jgi:signal transduction histidine kinase